MIKRLDISGRHVSQYLQKLLILSGQPVHPLKDVPHIRQMKESICYLSEDGSYLGSTEEFILPDKRVIKVGAERIQAPKILFDPLLYNVDAPGIADMIFNSVQESDLNIRSELYSNIVLAGGSTMFRGFKSRLEADLQSRYIDTILHNDVGRYRKERIRVVDVSNRNQTVFIGGSILSEMTRQNKDFWTAKGEYEDKGLEHCLKRLHPG